MKQYLDLMQKVLDEGTQKNDRTGTGTSPSSAIRCVLTCRKASRW
jgi:thymidylate synthase